MTAHVRAGHSSPRRHFQEPLWPSLAHLRRRLPRHTAACNTPKAPTTGAGSAVALPQPVVGEVAGASCQLGRLTERLKPRAPWKKRPCQWHSSKTPASWPRARPAGIDPNLQVHLTCLSKSRREDALVWFQASTQPSAHTAQNIGRHLKYRKMLTPWSTVSLARHLRCQPLLCPKPLHLRPSCSGQRPSDSNKRI